MKPEIKNQKNPIEPERLEKETVQKKSERRPSIRTYEGDAAEALKRRDASLVNIVIAEEKRRGENRKLGRETSEGFRERKERGRVWPLFTGLFLIVLGIGVVSYSLLSKPSGSRGDISFGLPPEPLIFSDEDIEIDATDLDAAEAVKSLSDARKNYDGELNSILNVYLIKNISRGEDEAPSEGGVEKRLLSARELLELLQTKSGSALSRNFSPRVMYGVRASADKNEAFLIFKIENFEIVFAEMLSWEKDIFGDLGGIFYEDPDEALLGSSTSTARTASVAAFEDLVIKNRDSRVLKNNGGEIIFLYSFPDRETLIISANRDSFTEILNRLTASRFKTN